MVGKVEKEEWRKMGVVKGIGKVSRREKDGQLKEGEGHHDAERGSNS